MQKIILYDTTLRDGAQTEGISFSVHDKMKIVKKLDSLGIHYIEGGWPANQKDKQFFEDIKGRKLKNTTIAAFGSTRRANTKAEDDMNLKSLIDARTSVVTIFGKTWDLHVVDILKTTLDENIEMIKSSVKFLKANKKKIFYDAEHFFDGYKSNSGYAINTILAAQEAGADYIILCDTNGGTMPDEIKKIVTGIKKIVDIPLGIHCHNDLGMAVANSIAAVEAGCTQIQGTFNGLGERCGNADLCTIIGILATKMKLESIPKANLKELMEASYYISEVSNTKLADNSAFVGHSAFAHKGGVHIDAVLKNPKAYEHIDPSLVGNHRRFVTSELAGKMPIIKKAEKLNIKLDKSSPEAKKILEILQEKENKGYQYEAADASFELLVNKTLGKYKPSFDLEGFKVQIEKRFDGRIFAEATVRLKVGKEEMYSASEGHGPVDALDKALRNALTKFYPTLSDMRLTDYKVRVIDSKEGTAAQVRVLIETQDNNDSWTTIGLHENIIEASWEALIDSIEYKLMKDGKK